MRYFQSGDGVASFSMATSEQWTKEGQKQERTEWHNVEIYGKLAKIAEQYLKKGAQAYIEGTIRTDEWTDRDGNKRKTTKVRVDQWHGKLVLLSGREPQERTVSREEVAKSADDDIPF
jgi:single-strand DNA-binding protein